MLAPLRVRPKWDLVPKGSECLGLGGTIGGGGWGNWKKGQGERSPRWKPGDTGSRRSHRVSRHHTMGPHFLALFTVRRNTEVGPGRGYSQLEAPTITVEKPVGQDPNWGPERGRFIRGKPKWGVPFVEKNEGAGGPALPVGGP